MSSRCIRCRRVAVGRNKARVAFAFDNGTIPDHPICRQHTLVGEEHVHWQRVGRFGDFLIGRDGTQDLLGHRQIYGLADQGTVALFAKYPARDLSALPLVQVGHRVLVDGASFCEFLACRGDGDDGIRM